MKQLSFLAASLYGNKLLLFNLTFIRMAIRWDFTQSLKSLNHLIQHRKQYQRKVLLSSFHLNGHTLWDFIDRLKS